MDRPLVLFVCTGNTCRSPLAEGLLRHALDGDPRFRHGPAAQLEVASAGLSAPRGAAAAHHTVDLLQQIGVDLSGHRSRRVNLAELNQALLILPMAQHHLDGLRAMNPALGDRLRLLSDFIPGLAGQDIPDPVGGPRSEYAEILDLFVAAMPALLDELERRLAAWNPTAASGPADLDDGSGL